MKKILQIFAILTIFISNNLIAEENLLTIKQQLDRLQRDVNDLSKSFYNNPAQQIQNSEQNNNIQSINFAAIDIRIYDLEKDIKNLTMNIEEILFQLDEINTKISEVEENFINSNNNIPNESSINLENENQNLELKTNKEDNTLGELKITSENENSYNEEDVQSDQTLDNQQQLEDNINLPPEDQFQAAFDLIRDKKYEDAKLALSNFIINNSENQLSGSAHYWLGELFVLEKNYREAALIFAEGYQKYSKSIKAPEMLYKLSEALIKIEKKSEACNTLTKLTKDFSKHKITKKAKNKILEISCDISVE